MTNISMSQLWTIPHTIVDVRAPIEFQKGHIPGAVNVPLLDDEQRHLVGLCYRQQGREAAILLGLELVGPKMAALASEGVALSAGQPLVVYCQRGGKRSQSMTWLWSQLGITVFRLEGGYKHFRQSVLKILAQPRRLLLLAGSTGVGKTDCLMQLKAQGEAILDLEGIANHKGSAFGAIGEETQPTQAQFENRMAWQLQASSVKQSIWVEAESRRIGQVYLPDAIWDQMQQAPRIYIDRPREDRIDRLCVDYQSATTEELQQALFHIRKRLGPQHYQQALKALATDDRRDIVEIVLAYYDRTYTFHREQSKERTLSNISIVGTYPVSEMMRQRQQLDEKSP